MKRSILSISLLLSLVIFSCKKQTELTDSIYIEDPNFDGLPSYTEWGYNTFGADYDRDYFLYSNQETPLKITIQDQKISYIFQGVKGRNYYENNYMSVIFILPDSSTNNYQDLIKYHEKSFDLTDTEIIVRINLNGNTNDVEILEGFLNFKRVQNLFIDDVKEQLIMSGTFQLKFVNDEIPSNLSNGRFDFGVDEQIFYNLH